MARNPDLEMFINKAIKNSHETISKLDSLVKSDATKEEIESMLASSTESSYMALRAAAISKGLIEDSLVIEAHENYNSIHCREIYEVPPDNMPRIVVYLKAISILSEALASYDPNQRERGTKERYFR